MVVAAVAVAVAVVVAVAVCVYGTQVELRSTPFCPRESTVSNMMRTLNKTIQKGFYRAFISIGSYIL